MISQHPPAPRQGLWPSEAAGRCQGLWKMPFAEIAAWLGVSTVNAARWRSGRVIDFVGSSHKKMGHSANVMPSLTHKYTWRTVNMIYAWEEAINTSSAKHWMLILKPASLLGSRSKVGGRSHDAVSNVNLIRICFICQIYTHIKGIWPWFIIALNTHRTIYRKLEIDIKLKTRTPKLNKDWLKQTELTWKWNRFVYT